MTFSKIQTRELSLLLRFSFHEVHEQLKLNIFTQIFTLKGFFFSLIHYARISKLFRDAEFTWRPRDRSTVQVKKVTYIGVIVISEQSLY